MAVGISLMNNKTFSLGLQLNDWSLHVLLRIKHFIHFINGGSISNIQDGILECEVGKERNKINTRSLSLYLTSMVSKSTTISLNIDRWSSKDLPFVMWWEYKRCFGCSLLDRLRVMYNCSNFNHNTVVLFTFNMSWRIWLEIWKCICDKALQYVVLL